MRVQHLDRHPSADIDPLRTVNRAHGARAERAIDEIAIAERASDESVVGTFQNGQVRKPP
jgi:hypothetical protein